MNDIGSPLAADATYLTWVSIVAGLSLFLGARAAHDIFAQLTTLEVWHAAPSLIKAVLRRGHGELNAAALLLESWSGLLLLVGLAALVGLVTGRTAVALEAAVLFGGSAVCVVGYLVLAIASRALRK
ncbi:MAG: hypothetical protein DLM71_05215 [Chloroflexi bacterium]|nr:MAG: hypothetical protein DLM71_05215 [Chloroflexota bacterium]